MSEQNTGGPAFPIVGTLEDVQDLGMTLRDYFAAKAMQELIGVFGLIDGTTRAYEWADAMLKARGE